jgi:hypothetical protein
MLMNSKTRRIIGDDLKGFVTAGDRHEQGASTSKGCDGGLALATEKRPHIVAVWYIN